MKFIVYTASYLIYIYIKTVPCWNCWLHTFCHSSYWLESARLKASCI